MRLVRLQLRLPRLGACLLCVCLLAGSDLSVAAVDSTDAGCSRLELGGTLVSESDLEGVETQLKSIVEAKLFYVDSDGYCSPTDDTYLVRWIEKAYYPAVASVLDGHSPNARIEKFEGEDILLVFYFSPDDTYRMQPYQFKTSGATNARRGIQQLEAPLFASNTGSIKVTDGIIVTQNQRSLSSGEQTIITETYRYEDGEFVAADDN